PAAAGVVGVVDKDSRPNPAVDAGGEPVIRLELEAGADHRGDHADGVLGEEDVRIQIRAELEGPLLVEVEPELGPEGDREAEQPAAIRGARPEGAAPAVVVEVRVVVAVAVALDARVEVQEHAELRCLDEPEAQEELGTKAEVGGPRPLVAPEQRQPAADVEFIAEAIPQAEGDVREADLSV